jgi:probable phosphoglycerate mutase
VAPLAAATGLPVIEEAALRELDYGAWDGLTPKELRQREPTAYQSWLDNPADHAPRGGETARQVAGRVAPLVDDIRARYPTGRVALFAHKSTLRILTCRLLRIDLQQYRERVPQPLASITVLEAGGPEAEIVRLGDTSHLPPHLRMAGS